MMDIYVQSCGIHPKQDYCWMKIITEENQIKENPPLLQTVTDINGKQGFITDFYYSEEPSIILAKGNNTSILVITALKAGKRSEIYGRPIRNSLVFISESKQNLEKISNEALYNWNSMTEQIDRAVNFDDELGFKVDRQLIEQYIQNLDNPTSSKNATKIHIVDLYIEEVKKKNIGGNLILLAVKIIAIVALAILIVLFWAKTVQT